MASNCGQDEQRIKKLFQACDTNGDGYIDSHDLLAICRELNLEHSLEELMHQLGADSNGRISYEQFLKRRIDLRPEIDAAETIDDISQGRLDSWEWDSGARDLSPVPNQRLKASNDLQESDVESTCPNSLVQKLLADQAQRYDQQITELHSVIAELTRKLQQQRTMAIAEEEEYEESSEIERNSTSQIEEESTSNINDTCDEEQKSEEQNCNSNRSETSQSNYEEQIVEIQPEVLLKCSAEASIVVKENTWPINHQTGIVNQNQYRTVRSADRTATVNSPQIVTKMAERVRLKRAVEQQTIESEYLKSNMAVECEVSPDLEVVRLGAQLDHARAQNALLALTLDDAKEQCNRLSLLCGKYESNAIALSIALKLTDSAIEAYDVLLALLETELSLDESRPDSLENRAHVETAAFQLLSRLENTNQNVASIKRGKWNARHEARLREHVSRLKQERASVRNTCVELESMHLDGIIACSCRNKTSEENPKNVGQINSQNEMRKMDLETAVLLQEMMSLREQKAELISRLIQCERERDTAMNRTLQINSVPSDPAFKPKISEKR